MTLVGNREARVGCCSEAPRVEGLVPSSAARCLSELAAVVGFDTMGTTWDIHYYYCTPLLRWTALEQDN